MAQGFLSWAQLAMPPHPARGFLSWAKLETPSHGASAVSAAVAETTAAADSANAAPGGARRAYMSWAQVETPPHLSNTYAAELREALTAADGFGSAVPAARIESASAQDTMTGALTARVYLSWVDLQLPPPTATTAETLNAISTASARVDARPTLLEVLAAADWTDGDHPPNLSAGLGEQLALADATDAALYAAGAVAENLVLLDHSACVGVLSGATVSEFAYATDESNGVHRAPDTFDAGPRHTFTLRRRPTQPGTITPPTPPLGG